MPRAALACCLIVASALACQSAPPPEPPPLRADYEHPHPAVEAFLTIADHRSGRGDRVGALAAVNAATRRVPTSGAAQLARAELLARSDDPTERAEAQEIVAAIGAAHPDAPDLPAARATVALGAGDPDRAWEAIEPELAGNTDPGLHRLAAEVLLEQGHETQAIEEADRALESMPRDGQALAVRAHAHQRLGADAAAAADARRALRVRPDDAELRLLQTESLLRTGKVRSAESALAVLDPRAQSARSERLAAAIALEKGDPTAAREAYERGLERTPDDSETLRALAQLDLAEGHPGRVLEHLADDATPAGTVLRARALHADERPDEAAAILRALLITEPDLLEPWGLLLAFSPAGTDTTERARAAWAGAAPDASADGVPGTVLLSALLEEDPERSGALYDEALARRPGLALAANNRANQLLAAGREPERALQLAETAHEKTAGAPIVADTLGWALLEASRPDEAIEVLSRGLAASDPRDEPSRILLTRRARAYEATGETAAALAAADALLSWHERRLEATEEASETPPAEPPWLADAQRIHDRLSEPEPEPEHTAAAPEPTPAPQEPTPAPQEPTPEPATEAVPDAEGTEATEADAPDAEGTTPQEPHAEPALPDPTTETGTATDG